MNICRDPQGMGDLPQDIFPVLQPKHWSQWPFPPSLNCSNWADFEFDSFWSWNIAKLALWWQILFRASVPAKGTYLKISTRVFFKGKTGECLGLVPYLHQSKLARHVFYYPKHHARRCDMSIPGAKVDARKSILHPITFSCFIAKKSFTQSNLPQSSIFSHPQYHNWYDSNPQ